jgi:hypothetical protein
MPGGREANRTSSLRGHHAAKEKDKSLHTSIDIKIKDKFRVFHGL